jgi:hypothetical protein
MGCCAGSARVVRRVRSCQANRSLDGGADARATTAFNKMLAIPGTNVAGVQFGPTGIVVVLSKLEVLNSRSG